MKIASGLVGVKLMDQHTVCPLVGWAVCEAKDLGEQYGDLEKLLSLEKL